jgi:hypothetical protein
MAAVPVKEREAASMMITRRIAVMVSLFLENENEGKS